MCIKVEPFQQLNSLAFGYLCQIEMWRSLSISLVAILSKLIEINKIWPALVLFLHICVYLSWDQCQFLLFKLMQVNNYIIIRVQGLVKMALWAVTLKLHVFLNIWLICYSIGGESLCVAQNTYAVKWFQGKELNMVFGLQLSFSRVVSFSVLKYSQVLDVLTIYHEGIRYTDFRILLLLEITLLYKW